MSQSDCVPAREQRSEGPGEAPQAERPAQQEPLIQLDHQLLWVHPDRRTIDLQQIIAIDKLG